MPNYIKYIEAKGVLGRFDIYQEFQPGVNVIFGRNGTGKTTLLHILANLLNGDYERFAFVEFREITVQLDDNTNIFISKYKIKNDPYIKVLINSQQQANFPLGKILERKFLKKRLIDVYISIRNAFINEDNTPILPDEDNTAIITDEDNTAILPSAYFPAFRTMIEAWTSAGDPPKNSQEGQEKTTNFARELFGSFVPNLNYPSPKNIEIELQEEIEKALFRIAIADRECFGEIVPSIFQALSSNTDSSLQEKSTDIILEEIDSLFKQLDNYPLQSSSTITELRKYVSSFQIDDASKRIAERVLKIYRTALEKLVSVQKDSFKGIETYLNAVNSFLEEKKLEIIFSKPDGNNKPSVKIKFEEGIPKETSLVDLSSGERQIVTLIYAATHMSKQKVVLIDEPEISLHVTWQRHLLEKMSEQLGDRQIIVCTHSPVIGADYEDDVTIFEPKITQVCENINNSEVMEEDSEVFDG